MIALPLLCVFRLAQDPVLIEVRTPRAAYYAQERIPVELRFGFEEDFLASQMLPLFRRTLDLPVILEAAWLPAPAADAAEGFTFALNGSEAVARRVASEIRAGRNWSFYSYAAVLRAADPGELALAAAALRYAVGSGFIDDPIRGRLAGERQERRQVSAPLRLTILPLPAAGRPANFSGAIGRFTLEAEAAPTDLPAGESLALRLRIRGEADPSSFEPPDLTQLPDFALRGQRDDRASPLRTVTYELLPRDAGVPAIPSIEFVSFDPGPPAAYVVARSSAIPLRVRGPLPAVAADAAENPLRLFQIRHPAPPAPVLAPAAFALTLLLPAILIAGAGLLRARRARDRQDPLGARSRRAAAEFRRAMARAPEQAATHLAEYLAARLRLPASALIAPALAERLRLEGLPSHVAQAAARTLEALIAARYGGPVCADGAQQARARVTELEAHWRARGVR